MLGSFSIQRGSCRVDDHSNRMRKVWLLLAYLIYTRNKHVTQDSYLSLFRNGGDGEGEDPMGRLKSLFYRARTMLDQLGDNAGHELILHKNGTYSWNTKVPIQVDVEEFDRLCAAAAAAPDEERQLELYLQALALYQGDFLPKLSTELWIMPISAYYHQLFLESVERTLALLEDRSRWSVSIALCQQALRVEPYSEGLYQHLMRCRLADGDRAGVISAYEEMSKLLSDTFGVVPSAESHKLYRDAMRENNDYAVPIDIVREQLREPEGVKDAMFCEYDFFKLLYQVQARAVVRSGDVVHIALLSLRGFGQKSLSRRSLELAMENLKALILCNLRQGDVVSRCSASQLIIMLPQANYENSCGVCQRIIKAFYRQYPHSPADIQYNVQPLEPTASPSLFPTEF
jgi:DNA-binding SARP family transcriptional activator